MITRFERLCDAETGNVVIPRLERADTLWKQTIGLIGRARLDPGSALWLEPCNGVHTFGMRFSLDILFLDTQGVVLHLSPNISPWRICGPVWGARVVVELPAGGLAASGIHRRGRYIAIP